MTGTCIDGNNGWMPSSAADIDAVCEKTTGRAPRNADGRLFAVQAPAGEHQQAGALPADQFRQRDGETETGVKTQSREVRAESPFRAGDAKICRYGKPETATEESSEFPTQVSTTYSV